jgi:NADH:ubiquinone oxidoreductase subunit F (NADH-binding)
MVNLSRTMAATSLCPLGQSLIMPVKSAMDNFRDEFLQKTIHPS